MIDKYGYNESQCLLVYQKRSYVNLAKCFLNMAAAKSNWHQIEINYNLHTFIMNKKIDLHAEGIDGMNQWIKTATNHLGFDIANINIPTNADMDAFIGDMQIEEASNKIILVRVNSSPQQIALTHKDCFSEKEHIVLLHACSTLQITTPQSRIIIPRGDGIVIPLWEPYVETSLMHRNTISLIINTSIISEQHSEILKKLWGKVSKLHYGDILNTLVLKLYDQPPLSTYTEKLLKTIGDTLSLQIEHYIQNGYQREQNISSLYQILEVIRSNMKNPNFCIDDLARQYLVTPRAIQHVLSKHNLTFTKLLQQQRCNLLCQKIKLNKKDKLQTLAMECGFKNIDMANRHFSKNYGVCIREFKKNNRE
ncbi:DNA-binding transcriptional activator FeaR [Edwardsiella tarda]|uniref:Helix-turn-helix domain-containing protein n=1 Tax=Edwardsiella tarda ATCC 15947 = NBRC 105688 TaxID=667121 RepID=A0AC61TNL4_EDWTA|nr:helix-turn-helix domain-containing protein [Edwardsiella tarda]UAL58116.1 helix-turn-helix domain-containing protein [Edwardsiella tarda]UCQ02023.1 helix-turn-helix domain-containing protein [Edwardsiella tarda ATCC 15947 = NBRC 105688]STE53118.1 DNA-binding transcriptional activator FeaR [Edwardsiella tarda]